MKLHPHNPRASNNVLIPWLALAGALLILGGFIVFSHFQRHERIEQREQERLCSQARVIEKNLVHQLDGVFRALKSIRSELQIRTGKSGIEPVNRHLNVLADAMPGIHTFLITDAEGKIIASNREQVIGANIRYRGYFQAPLIDRNLSTLYISPPFRTILGDFVINVTLMIPGSKGEFAGVVTAALDQEYFSDLMGSALYAPDMRASLSHGADKVFLVIPEHKEGSKEERLISQRTIRPEGIPVDKPLLMVVSRNRSVMYADWRRETYGTGAMFGTLVLATTMGLLFYQKRQRRFDVISADYEAAQRVSSERLRMATESTGLGVWDYDLENGRLTWDEAMFTIFGREPAGFSLTYNDWRDSVLTDDLEEVEAALQTAILGRQSFNANFRILRDDGEVRDIRCVAMVHCNESNRAERVIGINEDITKQKQAQLQLEELNKVLKQRTDEAEQAICSKNRFLDMVAHEFRTPLSLLTSSTDILDRYGDQLSEEQRTKQNGHIRSAASQISDMIDSVIVFNRQGADRTGILPERLNIGQICRAIAVEASTVWGLGQVFQVTVPADCETAVLNGILFRRVLENLLTNAFRYTPGDGVVSLHVTCDGGRLTILVTDSGIGIPEEERQRIFDAFYRCSNVNTRAGLGLGLSIVLEALSQMGGTISVDSTPGKGTEMQVVIPLIEESAKENCFSCIQS